MQNKQFTDPKIEDEYEPIGHPEHSEVRDSLANSPGEQREQFEEPILEKLPENDMHSDCLTRLLRCTYACVNFVWQAFPTCLHHMFQQRKQQETRRRHNYASLDHILSMTIVTPPFIFIIPMSWIRLHLSLMWTCALSLGVHGTHGTNILPTLEHWVKPGLNFPGCS